MTTTSTLTQLEPATSLEDVYKTLSPEPLLSSAEIEAFYREADLCLVTSLHDGMNLVAKEYIAARHDEQGMLILSRFTGASHELPDSLVVNPYDTDELAQAIYTALTMPAPERRARMQRMRAAVKENNVYRWAGNLIGELAEIRLETSGGGRQPKDRGLDLRRDGQRSREGAPAPTR